MGIAWWVAACLWAWYPGPYGFAWPKAVLIGLGLAFCPVRRVPMAAAAVCLVAALSCLWSYQTSLSIFGYPGEWTGLLAVLACAGLSGAAPGTRWLRWAGVLLAIHCVAQRLGYDVFHHLPTGARAYGWDGSPVDAGAILAMSASVVPWPWLPVVAAGLLATGSRAACLAAACSLLPGKTKWLAVPAVALAMWLPHQPKDQWRKQMWKAAIEETRAHPAGTGIGTFVFTQRRLAPGPNGNVQTHVHNDVLEALCTTGILGLLAWLWLTIPLYSYPPLLALLIIMKFDPVAFEVAAVGALLAGNVARKKYVCSPVFAAAGLALAAYVFSLAMPVR